MAIFILRTHKNIYTMFMGTLLIKPNCNSKLKMTQLSIHRWMDEQMLVYLYTLISFELFKEYSTEWKGINY